MALDCPSGGKILVDDIIAEINNKSDLSYVDTELDTKLNLTGGTLTGSLEVNSDFNVRKYFGVKNYDGTEDEMRSYFRDGVWHLYSRPADGIQSIVNIDVKGKVQSSEQPTSSNDLTRKDYVDQGLDLKVNSDTSADAGSDKVQNIVSLTQAEYDALTPVESTFYIIVEDL